MSKIQGTLTIKRILVAMDASSHSVAALEAAIDLASRFRAEVVGIYVEDENVLRLADLPFLQEVGHFSAIRRPVERRYLERQIRTQGRRARRLFTVRTERAQVAWTFRSVRGVVLQELLIAAEQADLLVMGTQGWSLVKHGRLGSTVRGILPQTLGMVLIVKEGARLAAPVATLFDGSNAAEKALGAAAALHRQLSNRSALIVLVMAATAQEAEALQAQASARLADQGAVARYRVAHRADLVSLASILLIEACGTVVLPADSSVLQSQTIVALLEQLRLPVLMVT